MVGTSFSFSNSTFGSAVVVVVVVDVVVLGGAVVVVVVLVVEVVGGLVWGLVTNAGVGLVGFAVDVVVVGAVEDKGCSSQEPKIKTNHCVIILRKSLSQFIIVYTS